MIPNDGCASCLHAIWPIFLTACSPCHERLLAHTCRCLWLMMGMPRHAQVAAFKDYEPGSGGGGGGEGAPAQAAASQEPEQAPDEEEPEEEPASAGSSGDFPPHTVMGLPALSPTMSQGARNQRPFHSRRHSPYVSHLCLAAGSFPRYLVSVSWSFVCRAVKAKHWQSWPPSVGHWGAQGQGWPAERRFGAKLGRLISAAHGAPAQAT